MRRREWGITAIGSLTLAIDALDGLDLLVCLFETRNGRERRGGMHVLNAYAPAPRVEWPCQVEGIGLTRQESFSEWIDVLKSFSEWFKQTHINPGIDQIPKSSKEWIDLFKSFPSLSFIHSFIPLLYSNKHSILLFSRSHNPPLLILHSHLAEQILRLTPPPLPHAQLLDRHRIVVHIQLKNPITHRLVRLVVELREIRVVQRLLHRDSLLRVDHEHAPQQVQTLRRCLHHIISIAPTPGNSSLKSFALNFCCLMYFRPFWFVINVKSSSGGQPSRRQYSSIWCR